MNELITQLKKPATSNSYSKEASVHVSQEMIDDTSSVVRAVMYRYSKQSHARFMQVPELCYLLIVFSLHPHAQELTMRKLETKPLAH